MKLLCFCIVVLIAASAKTGVLVGITPTAVNGLLRSYLPSLAGTIKNLNVPELKLPSIGKGGLMFDIALKSLHFPDFQIKSEDSGISFFSTRNIQFVLSDITTEAVFDWEISRGSMRQRGSTSIKVTKATLKVDVFVINSVELGFTIQHCNFTISQFETKVSGNPGAGIINWVLETLNNKAKEVIEMQISSALNATISASLAELSKLKSVPVYDQIEFSLAHAAPSTIEPSHMHFELEGLFRIKGMQYTPAIADPVPLTFTTTHELLASVSSYTFSSFVYAMYIAKVLHFSSKDLGYPITTTTLEGVFPQIVEMHGKIDADIQCFAIKSPEFEFNEGKIVLRPDLHCSVVLSDSSTPVELEIVLEIAIDIEVEDWAINSKISSIKATDVQKIKSSFTSEVDTEGIKDLINLTFRITRRKINQSLFGEPIKLPGKQFQNNVDISVQKGFIKIEGFLV